MRTPDVAGPAVPTTTSQPTLTSRRHRCSNSAFPGRSLRAWVPPARGQVHSAAAYGRYYYAGCSYAGAYVIDAKTLETIARIPCDYARDVVVRDGLLYVAQGDDGIGVYSLKDPARPQEVRRIREIAAEHIEAIKNSNARDFRF